MLTSSSDPQPTIRIDVRWLGGLPGSPIYSFDIHKDFLCFYSYFFRNACASQANAETPKFEVDYPQPKIFGFFVKWIYAQSLESSDKHTNKLVYLWMIADDLSVPRLQNQAITWLVERRASKGSRVHTQKTLADIYEYTTPGSPLRRYIADTWDEKVQTGDAIDLPQALPIDIINAKSRRANLGGAIKPADYFVDEDEVARNFAVPAEPARQVAAALPEDAIVVSPPAKTENEAGPDIYDANETPEPKKKKQKVGAKRRRSHF